MRPKKKKFILRMKNMFFMFFIFCGMFILNSCSEEENESDSGNVSISSISPLSGPAKTALYITGKNFGTDPSRIFVRVGGVNAKVIGSDGEVIYCLVPFGAEDESKVEVGVGNDANSVQYVVAEQTFDYVKTRQVKTLCGYVDEYGKSEAKDGSFDECGFQAPRWLAVDPKNQHHLYLVDGPAGDVIRKLDIKEKTVSTLISKGVGGWYQIRQISFSETGDTLLVANEENNDYAVGVAILQRAQNYQQPQAIVNARQNDACASHPVNGELYFNSRNDGSLYRYDWKTGKREELCKVLSGKDAYLCIFFHPTGKFAYICVPNQRVIMKAQYNDNSKRLENPTVFCGRVGNRGYQDGNGTNAILGNPMQGVFVKNEDYVKAGAADVYDFYFCDQYAHAVRYLTPNGDVRTFAGRGSKGLDDNPNGYVDGELLEEARFDQPQGLTFDSENEIFYIAEYGNKRIRTISLKAE